MSIPSFATLATAIEDGLRRYMDDPPSPTMVVFLGAAGLAELAAGMAWKPIMTLTKPLLVPTLTLHSLRQLRAAPERTNATLLALSAAFHTGGDIALLPDIRPIAPARYIPGELTFGTGHILGSALLARLGTPPRRATVAPAVAAGIIVCAASRAAGHPAARSSGVVDVLSGTYAAIVVQYALQAISALQCRRWDNTAAALTAAGGVAWLVSDALIALRLPLRRQSRLRGLLSYAVMDSYGLAQLLMHAGLTLRLAEPAERQVP